MSHTIAIHLLDSSQSHPLQMWEFQDVTSIQLGRSSQNDVSISHPFVSRSHATIVKGDDGWGLHVLSENGAVIDGQKVRFAQLVDGSIFQLASNGPVLRFVLPEESVLESSGNETQYFSADATPILFLDTKRRDQEVEEIIADPYFDQLQKKIKALRENKPE